MSNRTERMDLSSFASEEVRQPETSQTNSASNGDLFSFISENVGASAGIAQQGTPQVEDPYRQFYEQHVRQMSAMQETNSREELLKNRELIMTIREWAQAFPMAASGIEDIKNVEKNGYEHNQRTLAQLKFTVANMNTGKLASNASLQASSTLLEGVTNVATNFNVSGVAGDLMGDPDFVDTFKEFALENLKFSSQEPWKRLLLKAGLAMHRRHIMNGPAAPQTGLMETSNAEDALAALLAERG